MTGPADKASRQKPPPAAINSSLLNDALYWFFCMKFTSYEFTPLIYNIANRENENMLNLSSGGFFMSEKPGLDRKRDF